MSSRKAKARCPCPSKVGHPDEETALAAMEYKLSEVDLNVVRNTDSLPVRVYLCICGRWHLTSRRPLMSEPNYRRRIR